MRRLPRNVRVLGWVSLFQDAASELIYPILPLFVTVTLGAPPSALGLIEGVAEGTASIGKAVSGRLADRFRRRPMIAIGYGLSSLAKPLIGLAGAWPLVLVARFTDRVGKGIRTSPRDALIASDTAPADRGRAFGFHRAMDSTGAVIGPLLGLVLYELLDHKLRPLFFIAAVPAAVSVGLIWLVREPRRAPAAEAPPPEADAAPGEGLAAGPRGPAAGDPVPAGPHPLPLRALPDHFWRVVIVLGVFGLVNFSDTFLILRASDLGLGFVSVILVYALYNAFYAGLSYPAGTVADRIPPRLVFATGLAVFAIAYTGLGFADSSGWVWVLLPLYGAYTALTDGVGKAWIANLLPDRALGTGLGLYQALTGGCALIAGIWAGLAWGDDGQTPLIISGITAAVVAVALAVGGSRLDR